MPDFLTAKKKNAEERNAQPTVQPEFGTVPGRERFLFHRMIIHAESVCVEKYFQKSILLKLYYVTEGLSTEIMKILYYM